MLIECKEIRHFLMKKGNKSSCFYQKTVAIDCITMTYIICKKFRQYLPFFQCIALQIGKTYK